MKAFFTRCLPLMLALLLALTPALAMAATKHAIPETNVTIELPDSWMLITRENADSAATGEMLGLGDMDLAAMMEESYIYMIGAGLTDMTFCMLMAVPGEGLNFEVSDMRDYSDAQLDEMAAGVDELIANFGLNSLSELGDIDFSISTLNVYDTAHARWLDLDIDIAGAMQCTMFITIVQDTLYVTMFMNLAGLTGLPMGNAADPRGIVDTISFGGGMPLWVWIVIGVAVLLIIVLVLVLVLRGRKKKTAIPMCPACGNPVREDAAFCDRCGSMVNRQ